MISNDGEKVKQTLKTIQPDLNHLQERGEKYNILQDAVGTGLFHNSLDVIKEILDYNPDNPKFRIDINELDPKPDECTVLMAAAACGRKKIVELLLNYGANPHLLTSDGSSALHFAVEQKDPEIAEILLKAGVNPNQIITSFYSAHGNSMKEVAPIHIALTSSNPLPMIKLLVAYGADINLVFKEVITDGMEVYAVYEQTAFGFYTNDGKNDEKVEAFNKTVEEGLALKNTMLEQNDGNQTSEETDSAQETTDSDSQPKKKARLDDQQEGQGSTSSEEYSTNQQNDNQANAALQGDSNLSQRSAMPEISHLDGEENIHTLRKTRLENTNDDLQTSDHLSSNILEQLTTWIYELPEWLQEKILNSDPIKTLAESVEQAAIYDKKSVEQDFLIKMISPDLFDLNATESLDNNIDQQAKMAEHKLATDVDTNIASHEQTIDGLILPTEIEGSPFAAINFISNNEAINFNGLNGIELF